MNRFPVPPDLFSDLFPDAFLDLFPDRFTTHFLTIPVSPININFHPIFPNYCLPAFLSHSHPAVHKRERFPLPSLENT